MLAVLAKKETTRSVVVDRKRLLCCLELINAVIGRRSCKAILAGVRLDADHGSLRFAATDGEISLVTQIPAEGSLKPCVVPAADLMRRVPAARDATCTLALRPRSSRLTLTTGAVAHVLTTLPVEEFPPIEDRCQAGTLHLAAAELRQQLGSVAHAMAKEQSCFAITGALLECDDRGARVVTTDGRRMAIGELRGARSPFRGQVIVLCRLVALISKLAEAESSEMIVISIDRRATTGESAPPDTIHVAAEDWWLQAPAIEGDFPRYREVIPPTHSRFQVDRNALLEALREVAPSAAANEAMVTLRLAPRRIDLSTESSNIGRSTARVAARFLGGGDGRILTAVRPQYFADALRSLRDDQIVIDVKQNELTTNGKVCSFALSLCGLDDLSVRWLVMPLTLDLPPSREALGSNYVEQAA